MSILKTIIEHKYKELAFRKKILPQNFLEKSPLFERATISLKKSVDNNEFGIIAEHKRRSPSKPNINQKLSVFDVAKGYEKAGVSGISVLTDCKYFGGSLDDLIQVRGAVNIPVLRKEFIIDPYQIYEAKAYGADAILLIAAVLNQKEIETLSKTAKMLHLDVLLEVHDADEIKKALNPNVDLIGVNNRNLKTFEVSIENSIELAQLIPDIFTKVSESGLDSKESLKTLKRHGYKGFLMGEFFMKTSDPGLSAQTFINTLL